MSGVKLRTAQYWEQGAYNIPDDVADLLRRLDARFNLIAANSLDVVMQGQPDAVVRLERFQSAEELHEAHPEMSYAGTAHHAALLDRTRRKLEDAGFAVEITYR